jgi:hypothetical protein
MVTTEVLHQDHVLDLAARAIQPTGDSQPSLKTSYEAVALIGHASMTAVGFKLVGLGEDHHLGLHLLSLIWIPDSANFCRNIYRYTLPPCRMER